MNPESCFNLTVSIPFPTLKQAEIVYNSLRVDPEPKRSRVNKTLNTEGKVLIAHFSATELRKLRVAVNSFLELSSLCVLTISQWSE